MASASVSTLPIDRRQAIFLAVVEAQDQGQTVAQSRTTTANKFSVSESEVKEIEREGLENEWPPL